MSTIVEQGTADETLEDLLRRFGDVSPKRIRMHPAPGTATEEDVVRIEASENRLFELVEGVLVEKGRGFRESLLAIAIARILGNWVDARRLGVVSGADGMMKLFAGLVRIPDVAFVSKERLPGGHVPREAVPRLAPDLAVEVLSEGNTTREMERKRAEYFDAGVRLVWIVDPEARSVAVFDSPEESRVLTGDQTLDGGDVLPGFTLPLKELFSVLDI